MNLTPRHYALLPILALTLPSCMLGPTEIGLVALVVLLLFGGAKLPQLMRGMGSGINEFKKGLKEGDTSEDGDGDDDESSDATKKDAD
jgi:sec-independent protein translocase protein TatA